MWNPSMNGWKSDKTSADDEYLHISNCKRHIFDKLVLTCEEEIVNTSSITPGTTPTNLLDKKQQI